MDAPADYDSPDKKGSNKKAGENKDESCWERNVRRRVYDALNVLQAAGILIKEGKVVRCDPKVLEMIREAR